MTAPALLQGTFRLVLRLYPEDFRRAVGAEMVQDLRDGWAVMRRTQGLSGAVRFAFRQLVDLIGNVGTEWRSPSGPRVPAGRQGLGARLRALFQDLRFAARSLRRDPAFTATVLAVVGIGLASVITVYGMLDAILLEPLPYPGADRVVSMSESYRVTESKSVAYPNLLDWRERNRVFEEVVARNWSSRILTGEGSARSVWGQGVTPGLLPFFGVQPILGRTFTQQEHDAAERLVVVSEGFWRETLGGDADVLGRTILLDAEPYVVIGVVPEPEEFPFAGAELWIPLTITIGPRAIGNRGSHAGVEAFARMREGVTLEEAQSDLDRVAAELAAEYPDSNAEAGVNMSALQGRVVGDADTTLWILLVAVATVMLGVCANVASLMLARSTRRGGEIAVRAALGAGRGRLARQLLAEGGLLAVGAGSLGLAGAWFTLGLLRASESLDLPRLARVDLDPSVAVFGLAAAVLSALLFAGTPALRMLSVDPAGSLRVAETGRGSVGGAGWARSALVVAQVAFAVALLAGAGLMIRTLENLTSADLGLDPGNVVTAYVGPPQSEYPANEDRVRLYRELARGFEALPGVRRVSGGDPLPMDGRNNQWTLSGDGLDPVDDSGLRVDIARVMPGYFDVMGVELLAGRDFRETDTSEDRVAIIDETLAEFLWPEGEPLGNRFRFRGEPEDNPWFTVVGVVDHVKNYGARNESRYELYVPYTVMAWGNAFVVETEPGVPPGDVIDGMRRELGRLDPEIPLSRIGTIRNYIDGSVADEALVTRILGAFAAAALLVAVIGLYGVISYSVALRTREFGIRMALGADRQRTLRGVVVEGLRLATVGVLLGVVGAVFAARLLSSLLFGVEAADPLTLAGVGAVMVAVTLAATVVPAFRAVRVDPAIALRD